MRTLGLLAAALLVGCADEPSEPAAGLTSDAAGQSSSAGASRTIESLFPAAAEVRLFVNTGYDADGHQVFSSRDGIALTSSQRAAFEAALRIEPAPESLAACFIPHHFFRYFDKRDRQIGEIEVCFCCEGMEVSPGSGALPGPGEQFGADYAALKRLVESMGERTDIAC